MAQARKPKPKARTSATRKSSSASSPDQPVRGERGATPVLEWIAAGIGLAVLVLVVGFVALEAIGLDRSPAVIVVERLSVVETDAGYLVRIRAANRGGSPAAQVVVEGELPGGEVAEATFDFIADHSSREGGLFFEADPRQVPLTLRAKGYAAP